MMAKRLPYSTILSINPVLSILSSSLRGL
jgi:hypothetical protein